mgnify:CR=1 FL=1
MQRQLQRGICLDMHLCGKTFAMISAFRHVPESTISFLFNQFLKTQTVRILEAAGHKLVASITLVLRQCSWHVVNTLDIDTMSIVCDADRAYTVQSPKWAKIKRIQKFNSFQLSAGFIFLGCIWSIPRTLLYTKVKASPLWTADTFTLFELWQRNLRRMIVRYDKLLCVSFVS